MMINRHSEHENTGYCEYTQTLPPFIGLHFLSELNDTSYLYGVMDMPWIAAKF